MSQSSSPYVESYVQRRKSAQESKSAGKGIPHKKVTRPKVALAVKVVSQLPPGESSNVSEASSAFSREVKSLLKTNRNHLEHEGMSIVRKSTFNSGHNSKSNGVVVRSKVKSKGRGETKSKKTNVQSVLGGMSADPLRWFREEQEMHKNIPKSLSRNPVKYHVGPYEPRGILEPGDDEKLITIGGYIINMERGHGVNTSIRPKVSSDDSGLEIEIRITGCEPSAICFEKRYNAILVIGVKDSGLSNKPGEGGKGSKVNSKLDKKEFPSAGLDAEVEDETIDDDLKEVVNIFVPRDVTLARVVVTGPDARGRILVNAP